LVVPTTTGAIGASANEAPLDFVGAADAVLSGKNVLQRGSLVDVLCWNSERLVQAVLLAFGRVQPPKGRVTVDCVPPDPPEFQEALFDPDEAPEARKAHDAKVKKRMIDAAGAHQWHLRQACTKVLNGRKKCFKDYVQKGRWDKSREEFQQNQDATSVTLAEGVEADIEFENETGLRDMLQFMAVGAPVATTRVSYSDYERTEMPWNDTRKADFFDPTKGIPEYDVDGALKYDCEYETERVHKLLEQEMRKPIPDEVEVLNELGLSARPEDFDDAALEEECLKPPTLEELKNQAVLIVASQHVRALRDAHHEYVQAYKKRAAELQRHKDALQAESDTIAARNWSAFHASVALASAVLVAILGRTAAPRLRLAQEPGRVAPTWVRSLKAKEGSGDLSLFEAAIVLEQAVRSSA
tara:strand:- start:62 stop:1297 length:1236 start_codon:yes stop_codon:yes gene_type:complete